MKRFACFSSAIVGSLALLSAAPTASAAPPSNSAATSPAKNLVQSALEAGLAGDQTRRHALLAQAIKDDPDNAPAHWQLGQVKFEGKWQTPAEVGQAVKSDPRRQEYQKLRDQIANIADHVRLAQWCLRNNLTGEERFHWAVVLLADPTNAQARQRLGMREYHGGLFSKEQVAEHERQLKEAKANLQRYKPQFIELCRQARGEDSAQRQEALKKIAAVSDVGAVAALVEAIGRKEPSSVDAREEALRLALVKALSNMPEHEATLRLMNLAVFNENEKIYKAAAAALKPRRTTDYVPLMMAALSAPLEAEFDVVTEPDGTVRMVQTVTQQGPESKREHVQSINFEVAGFEGRDQARTSPTAVLGANAAKASARASMTEADIEQTNAAAEQRNARIQSVLKIAAGMDYGADPQKWWQAWIDENELHYGEQPTEKSYNDETYVYRYQQAPRYPVTYSYPGSAKRPPDGTYAYHPQMPDPNRLMPTPVRVAQGYHSCFAPGTPVWTQAGPRPIEQIRIGDLVLSQNPETGELDYRPVLRTTVGDPVEVLKLNLPKESIICTLNHRFWVEGQGWEMAKRLKANTSLAAVGSSLGVSSIDKAEPVSCHNLVVDEFHTFVVGQSQLLVHDISCPQPVLTQTPGFRKPASAAANY
jgi:hypothetical protein